jgi:regulator of RNase E activity RraB
MRLELEAHRKRNVSVLKTLEESGAALDEPRAVEHHFFAPTQEAAVLLAKELYDRGFLILMLSPAESEGSSDWTVEAAQHSTAKNAASEATTRELLELATRMDATYDGWGTGL